MSPHITRRSLAFASAAGTAVLVLTAGAAGASAAAGTSADGAAKIGSVVSALGLADAGGFLDGNGIPTVNVSSAADAAKVNSLGVNAKVVKYGLDELTAVKDSFDRFAGLKNTAWGIDTAKDQVVVTVSDAADPAGAAKLEAAAAGFGDRVRVKHTHGAMRAYIAGGDAITNSFARCSAGFNVRRGGRLLVLTAGHCTNTGGPWDGLGDVVASDCPGADSGLIENESGDGPSEVDNGQEITSVGTARVGESIRKSGSTTGVTSGKVTAVDQTVNFDVGVINHLIETTVYSDHGDSGGPAFDGSAGLGTLTGGDFSTTDFYPLSREFSSYGLSLP